MFLPVWLAAAIATVFYVLIPIAGAFRVRSDWRKFRKTITDLSLEPPLVYLPPPPGGDGVAGTFRTFGTLEGVDGERIMWVRGENASCSVDISKAEVFTLPSCAFLNESDREEGEASFGENRPERIGKNQVKDILQGTKVWVGGTVRFEGGRTVFAEADGLRPMVVFYDGDEQTLFRRCIWSGRQKNEYWNRLTPVSLTFGLSVLALLLLDMFGRPVLPLVRTMTLILSLGPLLPILPPGILCSFAYVRLWRKSRNLRADRDLYRSPLRYFKGRRGSETILPDGTAYVESVLAPGVPLPEGMKIRTDDSNLTARLQDRRYRVFASRGKDGRMVIPRDPLAEYIAIPGDPRKLIEACSLWARLFQAAAGAVFILGIAANAAILWVALRAVL